MGEFNHTLEHVNDLPADLLSVVLLEPSGCKEERFEHQPAQHQRAERPDDYPDIAGERGRVLVWGVAALFVRRLEQCDQPMHSGEIALERTRILTVEERAGQRAPVGLVRRTGRKEPPHAGTGVSDLRGNGRDLTHRSFEYRPQHFLL